MSQEYQLPEPGFMATSTMPDCVLPAKDMHLSRDATERARDAMQAALGNLLTSPPQMFDPGQELSWNNFLPGTGLLLDLLYQTNDPALATVPYAKDNEMSCPAPELFVGEDWRTLRMLRAVQRRVFIEQTASYLVRHVNMCVITTSNKYENVGIDLAERTCVDSRVKVKLQKTTAFQLPLILGAPYNVPGKKLGEFITQARLQSAYLIETGHELPVREDLPAALTYSA